MLSQLGHRPRQLWFFLWAACQGQSTSSCRMLQDAAGCCKTAREPTSLALSIYVNTCTGTCILLHNKTVFEYVWVQYLKLYIYINMELCMNVYTVYIYTIYIHRYHFIQLCACVHISHIYSYILYTYIFVSNYTYLIHKICTSSTGRYA